MWHGTLDSGLINLDHVVRIVAEPEKGAPPAPGMLQRYRVEFHLANGDVLHTIEYGDFSGDLDIPTPVIPAPPGYLGLKTHVISRDGRPEVAVRERMPIIGWTRTPAGGFRHVGIDGDAEVFNAVKLPDGSVWGRFGYQESEVVWLATEQKYAHDQAELERPR